MEAVGAIEARDELEDALQRVMMLLKKGNRGRELLDALRKLFQVVAGLSLSHPNSSPSLSPTTDILGTVLCEGETAWKLRFFCASLLQRLSTEEIEFVKGNLRQKYDTRAPVMMPLLFAFGSSESLEANLPSLVQWVISQAMEFRSASIPGLNLIAREHRGLLKQALHIKPVELQFGEFLSHASTVSEMKQSAGKSFWKLNISATPEPVTELDGTIAREFFTVLNNAQPYTEDQCFNICSFSGIHSWIHSLYSPERRKQRDTQNIEDAEGINGAFKEAVVSYCLRLIEQSKLVSVQPVAPQRVLPDDALPEIALLESIRILDLLSSLDQALAPRIFATMKKIFNRNTQTSGYVFLALLQFFINHSETVVYDPEPLFRLYFEEYLSNHYTEGRIAFETLIFCLKNKVKLLNHTNVFSTYFPQLLKILAWFPQSYTDEFSSLLPAFVSPSTCIELFHSLLDLPLMVSAMQKQEKAAMHNIDLDSPDSNEYKYRVLYNYLLRNESGVPINFWESSTTLPLLQQFCQESVISQRIVEVTKIIPYLLTIYFDVMISHADEASLRELVLVIFQRIDQLFPSENFQKDVRKVMEVKIFAIFHQHPLFVLQLKEPIIAVIADANCQSRKELILGLIWVVSEYLSDAYIRLAPEDLKDFHDAVDVFAYERVLLVVKGPLAPQDELYTTRLMLVVISSLSKFAARWQPLTSRVMLCLIKILKHQNHFSKTVLKRANECMNILKFPSIASCILDPPDKSSQKLTHIDANSSLPFMLVSTVGTQPSQRLHPFQPKE